MGFIIGNQNAGGDIKNIEANKWILVKNKLPEFDVSVLVYCRIYGIYLATYKRIDADYNWGEWRDFNDKICLPPTHWMELPEVP